MNLSEFEDAINDDQNNGNKKKSEFVKEVSSIMSETNLLESDD